MEPTLIIHKTEGAPTVEPAASLPQETPQDIPPLHHKRNIYPTARHMILVVMVLLAICIIFFLIHQNGKSIYDNGL